MDSNLRDETRNRRREAALARRLGEALDRTPPGGTESCPDAEFIAAYHEHALGPEEITQCEAHFASCSRCRKILAVLAASAGTPLAEQEVARLGELVAAAQVPRVAEMETAKPARPKRLNWRLRWLAPALGVAAVLAVWFAMKPPWRTLDQSSSGTLIAEAPKNEPVPPAEAPSTDQLSKTAPVQAVQPNPASPPGNRKEQSAAKTESPKLAAEAMAKNGLDARRVTGGLAASARVAEIAPENEKKEPAESSGVMTATPPSATASPRPLAQGQPGAAGEAASRTPEVAGSAAQSVTATGGAPVIATAGTAASNEPARDKQAVTEQNKVSDQPLNGRDFVSIEKLVPGEKIAVQIRTPSGNVLWHVGKNGLIERSSDAGKEWAVQSSPSQEEWLAGAAVSDKICWIVGRNGAIARTTDGEHWGKIPPPQSSADSSGKFPDWINVTAKDALTATITARDQRRFATQDGGKIWRLQ
jgi:hypothetical protein